jgi:hypothetical protein
LDTRMSLVAGLNIDVLYTIDGKKQSWISLVALYLSCISIERYFLQVVSEIAIPMPGHVKFDKSISSEAAPLPRGKSASSPSGE